MKQNKKINYQLQSIIAVLLTIAILLQSCGGSDPSPAIDSTPFIIRAGDTNADKGEDIAVDGSGNSYVVGTFVKSTKIGDVTLTSNTGYDNSFIAKINSKGEVLWAKHMSNPVMVNVTDVALDGSGNAYVCGYFLNTATFEATSITSAGEYDIFLAKYNSNGDLLWAKNTGGVYNDSPTSMAVTSTGDIYLTGNFYNETTLGDTQLNYSGKGFEIFLAKFNSSGSSVWAQHVGGNTGESENGYDVALDASENVYVTGSIVGTTTIGDDSFEGSGTRLFVAKYNSKGEYQWANVGYSGYSDGRAIAVDGSGNVFVAGGMMGTYFNATSDIIVTKQYTSYGFLAQYNANGVCKWAKNIPGQSSLFSAVADASGNVYVASQFDGSSGTVYFAGASGAVAQFNPYDNRTDAYVAKFNSNGLAVWAKRGGSEDWDFSTGIALDAAGNVYSTGYFNGATFKTEQGDLTNASSNSDIQIWKIKP